jgi:hypothetical protein
VGQNVTFERYNCELLKCLKYPIPKNKTIAQILLLLAEIVVESIENDGAYQHVADDWQLLPSIHESAWEFKDHIAKEEHALLRCTGLSRFRITAPPGLEATFNVLRAETTSQVPDPQAFRTSSDVGGWGDMETSSDTDGLDEGFESGARFNNTKEAPVTCALLFI